MRPTVSAFLFATVLGLGTAVAPSGARAEQAYPTVDLLTTGNTIMGEAIRYPTSGPAKVTVSIVTVAPGANTQFHRHPAPLVAYILEGELTVDYGPQGQKTFRQGEAMVETMDFPHRGLNFGTVPVRLLAVYLGAEGTPNVTLEK